MPTDYDQWPAFKFLAQEVADALTARRGEPWTVAEAHEQNAHPAVTLAGPDHARIYMQYGWDAAGKVTVKGLWPDGSTFKAPSRNVDPARGAKAIAQAICTYILYPGGYGYLAYLPDKLAGHLAAVEREQFRADVMARFAALVEADPPGDAKLSLSPYLPMRGEVGLDHHVDEGEDAFRVSLELHGLPIETAMAMVEVLAASPDARGRCCRRFGPGHDERLSALGCEHGGRTGPPTHGEGEALYQLYYEQTSQATPWPE